MLSATTLSPNLWEQRSAGGQPFPTHDPGGKPSGGQKVFGLLSIVFLVVAIWASLGCCCVLKRDENRDAACACCRP